MTEQEELQPLIEVKDTYTDPKKFVHFLKQLRFSCIVAFEDGTHIYEAIRQNMLASMSTEDIAQYNYEEFLQQQIDDKKLAKRDKRANRY